MKLPLAFLLILLFVTASVSAISIGSSTPHATIATIVTPTLTVTAPVQVSIVSTPSGAAISVDGSTAGTLTPSTLSLKPGTHTFTLSLAGYTPYTTTLTLTNGMPPQTVTAELRKITAVTPQPMMTLTPPVPHQADPGPMVTVTTRTTYPGGLIEILSGNETRSDTPAPTRTTAPPHDLTTTGTGGIHQAPTATLTVTPTLGHTDCPNAAWSCLSLEQAQQQLGYPLARYGDAPCGYSLNMAEIGYCYMHVDTSDSVADKVLIASGINSGDRIFILNETHVVEKIAKTGVKKETANAAPWQGLFDFFTGIVSGGSAKPESRLDIVGFNPQPEPPGKPVSNLEKVGLNPQPEPPAQGPAGNT